MTTRRPRRIVEEREIEGRVIGGVVRKKSVDLKFSLMEKLDDWMKVGMVTEYRFAKLELDREWRSDLAWPELMILVEVEGGIEMKGYGPEKRGRGGRHMSPKTFEEDCDKYNWAALLGWTLIRVTRRMIVSGKAYRTVRMALRFRNHPNLPLIHQD